VSLLLAERLDGEIVNADAMQVYRGFDIGTDKVSEAERARVPPLTSRPTEPCAASNVRDDSTPS